MEDLPGAFDFWSCYDNGWEDDTHLTLDLLLDEYLVNNEPYPDFIDIGAWVGPISLWVADRCPRVIAVEPDPEARFLLRKNLQNNQAHNVVVERSAFGNGSSVSIGVKATGWFGDSMTSSIYADAGVASVRVDSLTLNRIVEKHQLDPMNVIIKMDIEGGEADALVANLGFVKRYRPKIHLSFHGPLFADPTEYLAKMNFVFSELGDTRSVPTDFSSLVL